jgi:hypothetical protein
MKFIGWTELDGQKSRVGNINFKGNGEKYQIQIELTFKVDSKAHIIHVGRVNVLKNDDVIKSFKTKDTSSSNNFISQLTSFISQEIVSLSTEEDALEFVRSLKEKNTSIFYEKIES